ncbi:MAG: hypothetical protein AAF098_05820 [Pseudomonadota bacterium]
MKISEDLPSGAKQREGSDLSASDKRVLQSTVEQNSKRKSLAAFFAAIKFRTNSGVGADSYTSTRDPSGLNRGFARLKSCARKAADFPNDDDGWVRSAN